MSSQAFLDGYLSKTALGITFPLPGTSYKGVVGPLLPLAGAAAGAGLAQIGVGKIQEPEARRRSRIKRALIGAGIGGVAGAAANVGAGLGLQALADKLQSLPVAGKGQPSAKSAELQAWLEERAKALEEANVQGVREFNKGVPQDHPTLLRALEIARHRFEYPDQLYFGLEDKMPERLRWEARPSK